ncbi:MAG TPA: type IX secretion system plug protein domain-containing protein [Ignavibacteriales bacterium]|nr:type IX secretion system plug protein domain-containing protein [Ignavibacteriales bacterium]
MSRQNRSFHVILSVCAFLILFVSNAFAEELRRVLSLKAYTNRDETTLPVLLYDEGGSDLLTIEFDADADQAPSLSIVFKFCDRNWTPYTNLFLENIGQNVARNLAFEVLPVTVQEAKYHFKGSFPDEYGYVDFPFSGKWRFYITDSQDTSKVYASGKFYAVHPIMDAKSNIKHEFLEDINYFPTDLARVFNLTTDFTLPDELFPFNVENVEIIENHKIDYPYFVERKQDNTLNRYYTWDGNRKFSFTSKELRPGNEYRETDLRNYNIFNSRNVNAQFDGVETSRFFRENLRRDLNGGSVLTRYKDENAVYMNVTFRLRPPEDYSKKIFLVGSFTNWDVLPEYEMKEERSGIFTETVLLKRGIYDYQYVLAHLDDGKVNGIDWLTLEGNTFTTNNIYHVFIYYADPDKGGYDRIIGYQKVISK